VTGCTVHPVGPPSDTTSLATGVRPVLVNVVVSGLLKPGRPTAGPLPELSAWRSKLQWRANGAEKTGTLEIYAKPYINADIDAQGERSGARNCSFSGIGLRVVIGGWLRQTREKHCTRTTQGMGQRRAARSGRTVSPWSRCDHRPSVMKECVPYSIYAIPVTSPGALTAMPWPSSIIVEPTV
jgi:hypothetical protein